MRKLDFLAAAVERKLNAAQRLPLSQFAVLPQHLPAAQHLNRRAAVDAEDCLGVVAEDYLVVADLGVELLVLGFQRQFLTTKDSHVLK